MSLSSSSGRARAGRFSRSLRRRRRRCAFARGRGRALARGRGRGGRVRSSRARCGRWWGGTTDGGPNCGTRRSIARVTRRQVVNINQNSGLVTGVCARERD